MLCAPDETEMVEVDPEVTVYTGSGPAAPPEVVLVEGGGGGGGRTPVLVEVEDDTGPVDGDEVALATVEELCAVLEWLCAVVEAVVEPLIGVEGPLEWLVGAVFKVVGVVENLVRGRPEVPLGTIPVPLMRPVLPADPFNVWLPLWEKGGNHGRSRETFLLCCEELPSYFDLGSAIPRETQAFWSR
jgi:hypothetical protein